MDQKKRALLWDDMNRYLGEATVDCRLCIPGTPLISTDKATYHGNGTEYMVNFCCWMFQFYVISRFFNDFFPEKFVFSFLHWIFFLPGSLILLETLGWYQTVVARLGSPVPRRREWWDFSCPIPSQDLVAHPIHSQSLIYKWNVEAKLYMENGMFHHSRMLRMYGEYFPTCFRWKMATWTRRNGGF